MLGIGIAIGIGIETDRPYSPSILIPNPILRFMRFTLHSFEFPRDKTVGKYWQQDSKSWH